MRKLTAAWVLLALSLPSAVREAFGADLRIGMIGLDTSHAVNFTRIFHDAERKDHVPGARVVAAFKASSPDIPTSRDLVEGYANQLQQQYGVRMYSSIAEMAAHVDAIMVVSIDGRVHLAQSREAIRAGKPVFVDKPMAASLAESIAIFELARRRKVPLFSASSLRFAAGTKAVRDGSIGAVVEAQTTSPAHLEPNHIDLFWYGIHGVESLVTVMGPGIEWVARRNSAPGEIEVEAGWVAGRRGLYRESKTFGGKAVGNRGEAEVGRFDGYAPLLAAVVEFFRTGISPVPEHETLEILAFMEADALSKARNGERVTIREVRRRADSAAVALLGD
jgi:hypothetical protein